MNYLDRAFYIPALTRLQISKISRIAVDHNEDFKYKKIAVVILLKYILHCIVTFNIFTKFGNLCGAIVAVSLFTLGLVFEYIGNLWRMIVFYISPPK